MDKRKMIIIALVSVGVLATIIALVMWTGREGEPVPVIEKEPLVFEREYDQDGILKEEAVPSGEKILTALRSDEPDSVHSALGVLWDLTYPADAPAWPEDLSKEDIYEQLDEILSVQNIEGDKSIRSQSFRYAIEIVDPERGLDGYYRTEEDVQRVKDAIERWNATQSEQDGSWVKYELILDEDGDPVKLGGIGGGVDR